MTTFSETPTYSDVHSLTRSLSFDHLLTKSLEIEFLSNAQTNLKSWAKIKLSLYLCIVFVFRILTKLGLVMATITWGYLHNFSCFIKNRLFGFCRLPLP